MQRKIHMAMETGASNWLTLLPVQAKGFSINKQDSVDALALRYSWPIEGMPRTCVCGIPNSVTHNRTHKTGGFICIRYDNVRDLTASMLRDMCQDVSLQLALLPLAGEHQQYKTANTC